MPPNDPTTPTGSPLTQQQADLADRIANSYAAMGQQAGTLDTALGKLGSTFHSLENELAKYQINLNNIYALNSQQIQQIALVSTGFIKAREAFTGFANVDTSGLSTFSDQLKDIKEALFSGGTAASDALKSLEGMAKSLYGEATARNIVNEGLKKGQSLSATLLNAVEKETYGIVMHADNMLRLQNAYVQMAAATGGLADAWNAAGEDLVNINALLAQQTNMIGDSIEATGLSAKQVEDYYGQLGQIPGALTAVVETSGKAGSTTSMLTAAIQVATGTGRKYSDVMTDLRTAFKDYGLVGEDALKFSVRMSDVSTRLKAPIDDVSNALRSSADAFKMFTTGQDAARQSTESLASAFNVWGKALESTGLSASQSLDIVQNFANQASRFTTGQLAFISQRTGGAGGLLGAAQETVKLQKDPGAVIADAMRVLQQQFGRIVTVNEAAASGSEAMASQNIKQTLLLQQLLGPLAKDQASANRILEAMKNQAAGNPEAIAKALTPTPIQDAEDKGRKLEEGSYAETTKIRGHVERLRYLADQGSIQLVQNAGTARTVAGAGVAPTEAQRAVQTGLQQYMLEARARGGPQAHEVANTLATGSPATAGLGVSAAQSLQRAASTLSEIPAGLKAIADALRGAVSSGDANASRRSEEMLQAYKESHATSRMEEATKRAAGQAGAEGVSSPAQVGAAARAAAQIRPAAGATTVPGAVGVPGAAPPGTPQTVQIVGKFTIDCPHCGRPADVSDQAKIFPAQFNR